MQLTMKLRQLEKNFMKSENIRVIFDTNIWISFLIGKRLSFLKQYISNGNLTIITSSQLIEEFRLVTSRKKLKKYFPESSVEELIELLDIIGEKIETSPNYEFCRDPKDNFLFDLIDQSKADFLVTGDKDLLEHNPFKSAQIVTPDDFEKMLPRTSLL